MNHGHTLVVPREHRANLLEMSEDEVATTFKTVQKIARAVTKGTDATDFNLLMNTGENAGQVVHHAHAHIIPRYKGDNIKFEITQKKYQEGEAEKIKEKIIASL
eukprot:TRINITY_DN7011_c0_g1_i1.p1 TRINITY_DN7011_c0_g1~~TRINITY_DN7011_c0_g1_i1.p1  ORF type:complete len:104 (+),score=29.65 TRINITY_DN7011_c0_g1_i1:207-518(+)